MLYNNCTVYYLQKCFHMQKSLINMNTISPSAGESSVLHLTDTSWNHSKINRVSFTGHDRQTSETRLFYYYFNNTSSGQSHAFHVSTLLACEAGLAFCQQLRALGLNHLHVSVRRKAHSISFDSNKLAVSLTSVHDKFVASFRLFSISICCQCYDNYIEKNE